MLTVVTLQAKWTRDKWLSDGGPRGFGRLLARKIATGVWFYFGHKHQGKDRRYPLGAFDASGRRGLTLLQARDRVAELSRVYRSGITDIHGHEEREQAQRTALEQNQQTRARELQLAQSRSLERLLALYLEYLQADEHKRGSASQVKSVFRHVPADLKQRRASELVMTDFVPVIGAVIEEGKGPTARALRLYLRAAYQLAGDSHSDPGAPEVWRTLGVTHNPVADVSAKTLRQFSRARHRALDADELGAFLSRVDAMRAGAVRDVVLLCLYLGGQRPQQLLRLKFTEIDLPARTAKLWDWKGRRDNPRPHLLPLPPQAFAIVKRLATNARLAGIPRVWGKTGYTVVWSAVHDISAAMVAAGEALEPFQPRDLRRTCETMLAAKPLSVTKDIRAHILSHGIGGVQDEHYDMNEYMDEKRTALKKWAAHLEKLKARHLPRRQAKGATQGQRGK
jgi:integrase